MENRAWGRDDIDICLSGQICDIIFSKILGSEESWGDQN
jgi:hypothetical protein